MNHNSLLLLIFMNVANRRSDLLTIKLHSLHPILKISNLLTKSSNQKTHRSIIEQTKKTKRDLKIVENEKTLTALLTAWVTASHWSVCLPNFATVTARFLISDSIRFSFTKHSSTPPFTAFTSRSAVLAACLIASFLDLSVFHFVSLWVNLTSISIFDRN